MFGKHLSNISRWNVAPTWNTISFGNSAYLPHDMSNNSSIDGAGRDMDDLTLLQWLSVVAEHPPRCERWNHCRVQWEDHVEQLLHEGNFEREYWMSAYAYDRLVELLSPRLQRVEYNSRGSTGPILVERGLASRLKNT